MNDKTLLSDFCGGVEKRMGIGWETLIVTLLPVLIEMLTTCFNKPADLQSFAEGQRSQLQLAGLRIKCRRVARENGVVGVVRVMRAGEQLKDAVLAELDDRKIRASGDLWQDVMDEAGSV